MTLEELLEVADNHFVVGKTLFEDGHFVKAYGELSISSALLSLASSKDLPEEEVANLEVKNKEIMNKLCQIEDQIDEKSTLIALNNRQHLEDILKLGDENFLIAKSFVEDGSLMKAYGKLSSSSALFCAALGFDDIFEEEEIRLKENIDKIVHRQSEIEEHFEKTDTLINMVQTFQFHTDDRLYQLERRMDQMIDRQEEVENEGDVEPVAESSNIGSNTDSSKEQKFEVINPKDTLETLCGKVQRQIVQDIKKLIDAQNNQSLCFPNPNEEHIRAWLLIGTPGNGDLT